MASFTALLFFVFTLFCLLFFASSSEDNTSTTITVPLTSTFTSKRSTEPLVYLQELASASLARAHHLKHGKTSPPVLGSVFARSYGGHVTTLSFGTPPQKLSYLVDTGSHVVWAPCGAHYTCTNCTFSAKKVRKFNPKLSSSSWVLGCRHPMCSTGCHRCKGNSKTCSHACLPYTLEYGTGAESGVYLLENLIFPGKTIPKFVLGCTTLAVEENVPAGLAGFGRSKLSLPVQMGVTKFAYCLNSHAYDDKPRHSGKLVFDYSDGDTPGLSYAPFFESPTDYSIYYYLGVKYMVMGDELLRIPSKYLAPGADGKGGVMIDSGTTYGYMAQPVFKIVTDELKKQMSMYKRSPYGETITGYTPCYNYTGHKSIKIPRLIYHFTSGVNMLVPGQNYFITDPESKLACFAITTDSGPNAMSFTPGPSLFLGNYQHLDYYVEYDLKNNRFGFRRQAC